MLDGRKYPTLTVRDHIPLEQGLRPASISLLVFMISSVRDHIPLEQGLRPTARRLSERTETGQRPYSIRTRIKTHLFSSFSTSS